MTYPTEPIFQRTTRAEKQPTIITPLLAYLCRKFVIFAGRENCKSLRKIELKNYGIFKDSRIVQSQHVLYG